MVCLLSLFSSCFFCSRSTIDPVAHVIGLTRWSCFPGLTMTKSYKTIPFYSLPMPFYDFLWKGITNDIKLTFHNSKLSQTRHADQD